LPFSPVLALLHGGGARQMGDLVPREVLRELTKSAS
jgi:hypothetical protein